MLYLRTFGGLTLDTGGGSLTGAGAQRSRLALLAVLAAAGERGVSRESLLAIFWPESDTDQARGALKQGLYALRRDLGGPELISGNDTLILNPAVIRSDVGEFNQALEGGELERAVALYRGKYLEGVHINGGEFDRWLEPKRARLHELFQDALGRLARNAENRSEYSEAVRWWRALAAADSLSAVTAAALMRALAKTGDSGAALSHARIYEQLVRSELDAAPDKSVLALAAQISRGAAAQEREQPAATAPLPEPALVPDAAAIPAPARPVTRRRKGLAAGIALAAIVAAILAVAVLGRQRLDPDGIVLIPGALDSVLMAELTSGLAERDPTLEVALQGTAAATRSRYLIRVSSAVEGDSVRFVASVTDVASETSLGSIEPVMVLASAYAVGARVLRDRVAVVFAARRNPLFANWAHAAALPNSWESFEQLELGIRAFTSKGPSDARPHFRRAAALDSTSGSALLWEAFVIQGGSPAESDSILTSAERSGRRLGPWERALAVLLRAQSRHDNPGAHAAGHRLLDVVPGSEWAILVARDALALGRAREAAELSEAVSNNPGWTSDWWVAVITRDQAYHSLGDFQNELEVVREALRRDPDSRLWLQAEVKALAGLGRVPELMAICQRAVALRPEPERVEWWPCDQALLELAAHGHMEEARALGRRLLPAREKQAAAVATNGALTRAGMFAMLVEWESVDSALHEVSASETAGRDYLELLSPVQAFHKDKPGAVHTLRRIDSLTARDGDPYAGGDSFHRAGVFALLGERDAAIDFLEQAFREGFGRIPLHWAGPLDALRGYPRFDALARLVEDPEHLARVARR